MAKRSTKRSAPPRKILRAERRANILGVWPVYTFERPSQPLTILLRAPAERLEPYFFALSKSVHCRTLFRHRDGSRPAGRAVLRCRLTDARLTPTPGPVRRGLRAGDDHEPHSGARAGSGAGLLLRGRQRRRRVSRRLPRPQPRPRPVRRGRHERGVRADLHAPTHLARPRPRVAPRQLGDQRPADRHRRDRARRASCSPNRWCACSRGNSPRCPASSS